MKIYESILDTVGNTPLVKIKKMVQGLNAEILAKLEFFNPTSSVKDRIAVNMVTEAEKSGQLKPGGVIIEPTSGNTGLGLAMVAASKGYKLIIVMPESMSEERKALLRHLGAELVLTPGEDGMPGAIGKAEEIFASEKNAFMPHQFDNPANPATHENTTGREIWNDTDGKVDIVVAGVGTGGTITGIARALKSRKPQLQIVAVEPENSAVLSHQAPGFHNIQGIGAGFVPEVLKVELIDEVIKVSDAEAVTAAKEAAKKEGILCGISSGAALHAALKLAARKDNKNKKIVVILPDTGERYLSTPLFS